MKRTGIRMAVAALAALAAGLLPSVTASAQAATPAFTTISKQSAADPGFAKFGSSYYVYATGGSGDGILPIFRGSSLSQGFAKVGNAYASAPSGLNSLWAPHVVARDGLYFMFFTAATGSAPHCVYWAVASTPTGSFSAPHLATCGNATGWEAIDPTVYRTASGQDYLVWKRGHYHPGFPDGTFQIRARKLTFSGAGVSFSAGSNPSLILAQIPDGTVMEAPSLVAHGGKVWLFVARGRFDTNAYHTDVWVAKRFGPGFTYSNHVMATGQGYGYGPGGAEVITDSGGIVRIAWHVWEKSKPTPQTAGTRIVRVGTVTWPGGQPHVA